MAMGATNASAGGGGAFTPAVFVYGENVNASASVRIYNTSLGVEVNGTFQTITYNGTEYTGHYITGIPVLYSYKIECVRPDYTTQVKDIFIDNVELTMVQIDIALATSWAGATPQKIVEMVNSHRAGTINIYDYWSVGDTKTIQLPAMPATNVGESHAAQTVQLVLMDSTCTGFTLTSGGNAPLFIVGMKNCLNETGYMNSTNTNTNGWSACARRTWCNSEYKTAMDSVMPNVFKQFTWKQGKGKNATSGLLTTSDYFALAPAKAVFGSSSYSQDDEAALYANWGWYQTSANRIKTVNGSSSWWWECSPRGSDSGYFCGVDDNGIAYSSDASDTNGISPFGCI